MGSSSAGTTVTLRLWTGRSSRGGALLRLCWLQQQLFLSAARRLWAPLSDSRNHQHIATRSVLRGVVSVCEALSYAPQEHCALPQCWLLEVGCHVSFLVAGHVCWGVYFTGNLSLIVLCVENCQCKCHGMRAVCIHHHVRCTLIKMFTATVSLISSVPISI